ncbi:hypothetical protein ABID65_006722 [Bradyrhizobium sp. S3.9.2]|uniref:hypothetical protein n=1 Tax=Bradyrhizobium sp. S3.9.2 TaxID=3156432 RepID=UPI00339B8063
MSSTTVLLLPYRHRLLINMVEILMLFFNRDERVAMLIEVMTHEASDLTEDDEQYDAFADAVANAVKLERRIRRLP